MLALALAAITVHSGSPAHVCNCEVNMVHAIALPMENSIEEAGRLPTRHDVIARYRHLRAISKKHHSKILDLVSPSAMLQQARRLGLSDGKRLILDNTEELDLLFDLLVYAAPAGRSRAMDRYARNLPHPAGSDEALMLDAMRRGRYAILEMQRPHPAAGHIFVDGTQDEEIWLVDEGFETWMKNGALVATRYVTPGPFSMTAGACVPLDRLLLTRTLEWVQHLWHKRPVQMLDDPRFAEALYRCAIASGVMERVRFRDMPAEDYAA